ncbi:MAG TPA: hypothetical protein VKD90_02735 [Gemmataceae bacterium]|nr:hypothetical protein [Gemmataceae bacterium]
MSQPRSAEEIPASFVEHAYDRLNEGSMPSAVIGELIRMGLTEDAASEVVRQVRDAQAVTSRQGSPKDNMTGLLLMGLGGFVAVVGAILWIGNMTGFFPTFPFAGIVTILIGGAIYKAGSNRAE